MLQMYVYTDQSPLFVLITPIHKQWRLAQISVYIHVPFDRDVFIKNHLGASSIITDQASMYSLVSFFFVSCNFFHESAKI